jgi:hypothetical protein
LAFPNPTGIGIGIAVARKRLIHLDAMSRSSR